MVINCAAYQGGCRVADIDLDQARKVDTSDGRFVWIGLHEPDQPLLRMVQQRFGLHDGSESGNFSCGNVGAGFMCDVSCDCGGQQLF
jgi:hypothetical protein